MGGDAPKTPNSAKNPAGLGASTPNLFNASQQYMPANYFDNQPISNPTGILNAYMQHLPAFMNAAKSVNNSAPAPVQTTPGVQTAESPAPVNPHSTLVDLFNLMKKKGTS